MITTNISSATGLTPFSMNKGFHPRMSFDPDSASYETTRERPEAAKAEDISSKMKKLLEYGRNILINSREAMRTQANKHRKDVTYNVGIASDCPQKTFIESDHARL